MKPSTSGSLLARISTLTFVCAIAALPLSPFPTQAGCVAPPSGLVSWWRAEGNASDGVGNLTGYPFGGTTFATGKVGQAFSFDGINDSITNAMSGLTNILDSYTMELWVWPTAARASTPESTSGVDGHGNQRYAVFPHVGPTGGTVGAGISVGTNGVSVFEAGDTYLPALLVFDAPIIGWTHIAVVYTNRQPSLYVNGVLVRSGLTSVNHSCPSTWLGERGPASANQGYYAGLLDEYSIYNRSLSAAEVQALYGAGSAGKCTGTSPPPCVAAPPGLAHWWTAEGNVADHIGSLNGYLYGGTTFAPGKVGQAFSFDGINDSITNAMSGLTNILDSYTMELWAWPTAGRATTPESTSGVDGHGNQRYAVFPHVGPTGGTVGAGISIGTNGVSVFEAGDTYLPALLVFDAPIIGWTHVAVVYSNRQPSLYLNGALVRTGLTSANHSCPSTWLGERGPASANQGYYAGLLDEYAIYNRSLSAAEVQALYSPGKCGSPIPPDPFIVSQPTNQAVIVGGMVNFTVVAGGTPPLSYQWRLNATNITGATENSLVLTNVQLAAAGLYSVVVSNPVGAVTSSNATLTINSPSTCVSPPLGLVGWWTGNGNASDIAGNNNGVFVNPTFGTGEVNQAFSFDGVSNYVRIPASATLDVGVGGGMTVEAWIKPDDLAQRPIVEWALNGGYGVHVWANALSPGYLYASIFGTDGGDHIIQSSASVLQSNVFQHVGVTYDKASGIARLFVNGATIRELALGTFTPRTSSDLYIGYRPAGSPFGPVPFRGQIDEVSLYNRALSAVEMQTIYNVGSTGKCLVAIPPLIALQPVGRTVIVGGTATFEVSASGTAPLSYQWQRNTTNISGATARSLVLTNIQLAHAGVYRVVVSNAGGTVISSNATLTVNLPPSCIAAPSGLVSWWSGNGDANDLAGANPGNFVNGATFAAGEVGQAFSFGGSNNYVRIPASPSLDVGRSGGLTIEAWVNPADLIQHPVVEWAPGGGYGTHVWINSQTPGAVYANLIATNGSEHILQSAAGVIAPNVFQHLAVTYDRATGLGKIYVNGALVREAALGNFTPLTSSDMYIGYRPAGTPGGPIPFNGFIDEVSLYSRALSLAEVQGIYNAGSAGKCVPTNPPACVVAPAGLVSWWRAEGNSQDTADGSNGVLLNGAGFAVGEVGQAFKLDGVQGHVRVADQANLRLTNALTVEAWINPASIGAPRSIVSKWDGAIGPDQRSYVLGLQADGSVDMLLSPNGTASGFVLLSGTNAVPVNQWTHVAGTYDGAALRIYVNGALQSQAPYNLGIFPGTTDLGIGANVGGTAVGDVNSPFIGLFAGLIDEASIYDRALTPTEIQAAFTAGSAGKCVAATAPVILSQPTNQAVLAGGTVTFAVVAGGTPPLAYQWRHEGTNLAGAINSTLVITNAQASQAGSYAVVVSNSLNSVTSSNAVLTINATPPCAPPSVGLVSWWRGAGNTFDEISGNHGTIVGDAAYVAAKVGQGFVFDGSGDTVQLGNPTNLQTQNFTIEAWIKRAATNRVSLNGNGNGTIFGHDIGGYGLYLDPTGRPALTKVGVNNVTLSTRIADTNFHHLAVTKTNTTIRFYIDGVAYSVGSYNPGFVFTKAASIGGIGTNFTFLGSIDDLSFYNRALTTNEVRAIYNAGSAGKCVSLTPPVIVAQPSSQSAIQGDSVAFAVQVTGTPPLSYQWRFNGTNVAGAIFNTLLLTNVQFADSGAYSVILSNAAGTTNSSSATLTVNPPPPCTPVPAGIISWWRAEGNGEDFVGTNAGALIGGLTFTNGEVHQAFGFDGVDDYVLVSNAPSLNFGAGQDFSVEAWIQPQVSTTTFDVMTIVDKRNAPDIGHGIGYEVAVVGGRLECRISDSAADVGTSFGAAGPDLRDGRFHHVAVTLVRNSSTGGHYYVDGAEVLTFDPTVEAGDLTNDQSLKIGRHATPSVNGQFKGRMDEVSIYERALTASEVQAIFHAGSGGKCLAPTPPTIVAQPANQSAIQGDAATFTVTVAGTPPLSYQWQFNGTNIADATNSTFTLPVVQFSNAGNYAVLVANGSGSLLSSNAVLTVNPPPPCAPLPAGLISWWRAEANATDAVGATTGTLIGGLAFTNGLIGQAFSFDGVDDYVLVSNVPSLNFGANQDFSIEAWVQPEVSATTFDLLTIVDKRNAPDISTGIGYEVALTGGRLECRISDSLADVGTSFGAAGPDLRDGHFHHVAVTFHRSATNGGRYYVDGAAVLTFDPTVEPGDLSNDQPLRIGSHATPSVFAQFKGRIDELAIYNQSLSASDIQAIYNAGKSGKCVPPPLPDLALTLSATPDPLSLGQRLTYTLHLTNSGLGTATNIVLTDPLPDGVAFVSAGNGGSFSNGVVTFRLDTFASGANTDLTVVVLTTVPGVVTNTVTVSSDTGETSSTNNTASVTATVLFQSSPGLLVTVTSPMTLNRQTGLMEQRLRLTNQGTNTVFAARVFLCGLPTNAVYNASGFANGCPFVQYNRPLAPGATVDFLMEYYLRRAVPDPTLVAVETPLNKPPGSLGTPFNIDRSVKLSDGRFLIEFTTTPGRIYTIQYSDDADGPFKTAVPAITAPANRLQWLDDGPPKTESKPTGASRFYRVFETTAP